jgi:hypothetical protein
MIPRFVLPQWSSHAFCHFLRSFLALSSVCTLCETKSTASCLQTPLHVACRSPASTSHSCKHGKQVAFSLCLCDVWLTPRCLQLRHLPENGLENEVYPSDKASYQDCYESLIGLRCLTETLLVQTSRISVQVSCPNGGSLSCTSLQVMSDQRWEELFLSGIGKKRKILMECHIAYLPPMLQPDFLHALQVGRSQRPPERGARHCRFCLRRQYTLPEICHQAVLLHNRVHA